MRGPFLVLLASSPAQREEQNLSFYTHSLAVPPDLLSAFAGPDTTPAPLFEPGLQASLAVAGFSVSRGSVGSNLPSWPRQTLQLRVVKSLVCPCNGLALDPCLGTGAGPLC